MHLKYTRKKKKQTLDYTTPVLSTGFKYPRILVSTRGSWKQSPADTMDDCMQFLRESCEIPLPELIL